ncbi:hypothetical protein I215_12328 [Galbibacter marinus]|uniref:KWG repeat-containing protein n=1 Tax=Galbibacter marinus TaxID=555500 RepID=K2Q0L3_9FLAO|nr:WG repeat-containing protein [Galbibacter marinus]EKF54416.1 hypothetical protein I215_12328 [Galbibacter marinus]
MKTFISNIIPKIKEYSKKLNVLTNFVDKYWILLNEEDNTKLVYIFRGNNELLISLNGIVNKGKWEYLGKDSLLIEKENQTFLFRHGFLDDNIFVLKVDGKNEYAFFMDEEVLLQNINKLEQLNSFLEKHYLLNNSIEEPKAISTSWNDKLNLHYNPTLKKFGYVGKDGNILIKHKYSKAYEFIDGVALVYITINYKDKYGFIMENGETKVPLIYDYAEEFSEGLAVVRKGDFFGYINKKGETIIDIIYDDAYSFKNGRALVKRKQFNVIYEFYIDKNGNKQNNQPVLG